MGSRRSLKIGLVAAAVAAAAAAAILLNLALLGYAQPRNDPVGKLSPRAVLTGGTATTRTPVVTVEQHNGGDNHDNDD